MKRKFETNLKERTTLGDFLAWAQKNKWWLRGFESIERSATLNGDGWAFLWCNQCGFVSDEDINKIVPEKTAGEWDAWGR